MCRENILSGMQRQHLKIGVCTLILDVTRQKVGIILNASLFLLVLVL